MQTKLYDNRLGSFIEAIQDDTLNFDFFAKPAILKAGFCCLKT